MKKKRKSRKSPKSLLNEEKKAKAFLEYCSGKLTPREASKKYNISEQTLGRYFSDKHELYGYPQR